MQGACDKQHANTLSHATSPAHERMHAWSRVMRRPCSNVRAGLRECMHAFGFAVLTCAGPHGALFLHPSTRPRVLCMHAQAGMERKDVMSKNVTIYRHQAEALALHASKDVKVCDCHHWVVAASRVF